MTLYLGLSVERIFFDELNYQELRHSILGIPYNSFHSSGNRKFEQIDLDRIDQHRNIPSLTYVKCNFTDNGIFNRVEWLIPRSGELNQSPWSPNA
ncbi:hypothetical protein BLOT_007079 [Blomia tropicalis]|nr:hypothetical protein BLOT_007079 [Blomia tropicalis]